MNDPLHIKAESEIDPTTETDDDSLMLEAKNCSIEMVRNAAHWPEDLNRLGAICIEVAEITLAETAVTVLKENHIPAHISNRIALSKSNPHINVLLSSNQFIQGLNKEFRDKDTPTNVLSFPTGDDTAFGALAGEALGDIILGYETIEAEAEEDAIPFDHHFAHLVVHGVLHLLGLDHMEDNQAEEMEAVETRVLAKMNIADPYAKCQPKDTISQLANGE